MSTDIQTLQEQSQAIFKAEMEAMAKEAASREAEDQNVKMTGTALQKRYAKHRDKVIAADDAYMKYSRRFSEIDTDLRLAVALDDKDALDALSTEDIELLPKISAAEKIRDIHKSEEWIKPEEFNRIYQERRQELTEEIENSYSDRIRQAVSNLEIEIGRSNAQLTRARQELYGMAKLALKTGVKIVMSDQIFYDIAENHEIHPSYDSVLIELRNKLRQQFQNRQNF